MKLTQKIVFGSAFLLPLLISLGCSKSSDSTSTDANEAASNVSESAMAEAGSQATSSEGASAPGFMADRDLNEEDVTASSIQPLAACTFASTRSTCASNADTITWGGCTVPGTLAVLTGGWTESWTAGFCANGASPGALTNTNSVTRTTAAGGQVLTLRSGATVTTDTSAHNAYDGTSIPGTGITTAMASGTRTITINGVRRIMKGPLGRTWYDHSITSTGLSVTGTKAGGNRVITGTTTLYHNLAQYKAVHTFNSVTWGSSSCCYPTSGSISSVLTGTRAGNVTLTFASCGTATFVDTDSTATAVALSQCN